MGYEDIGMLPKPVDTAVIRTPATGPDPLNVLAFVRFRTGGVDIHYAEREKLYRWRVGFLTQFMIDGFTQADHEWYQSNTLVSATASLTMMNIYDDTSFVMAVDAITPFVDLSGALGFTVDLAIMSGEEITFSVRGTAYVACFEPQREPMKTRDYHQGGALPSASGGHRDERARFVDPRARRIAIATESSLIRGSHIAPCE